jgi:hypothetical protein
MPYAKLATALVMVAVLGTGCTRAKDRASPDTTIAPSPPIEVQLRPSGAAVESDDPYRLQVAKAVPELDRFLTRFLHVAFNPAAARGGYAGFTKFFIADLQTQVNRDMASLTLGPGGARVERMVATEPALAVTKVLLRKNKPLAASVILTLEGTASTGDQEGAVSLDADLYLLRGKGGWTIASYDSKAVVPE